MVVSWKRQISFVRTAIKKVKINIWIILIPLIILALLIVLAAAMPYLFPEGVVESEAALCNCFSTL